MSTRPYIQQFREYALRVPEEQRKVAAHVTDILRERTPKDVVEVVTDLPDGEKESFLLAARTVAVFLAWTVSTDFGLTPEAKYKITSVGRQDLITGSFGAVRIA